MKKGCHEFLDKSSLNTVGEGFPLPFFIKDSVTPQGRTVFARYQTNGTNKHLDGAPYIIINCRDRRPRLSAVEKSYFCIQTDSEATCCPDALSLQ